MRKRDQSRLAVAPVALAAISFASFVVLALVGIAAQTTAAPPAWAYGVTPAGAAPAPRGGGPATPDDGSPKHLDGSTQAFTLAQLRDSFNIADWFPSDHPPAPDVVMKGRAPNLRACGLCHYPNGRGRPENSGIANLPVAYFTQQIADFKNGLRTSAETRKTNTGLMVQIAKAMTDDDVKAAAEYFGSIGPSPWIKVVETDTVPKTRLSAGMFTPLPGSESEPIGARIIEVPAFPERTDLRDPRAGFIAYVPKGSLAKGKALVTGGDARTTACATCHGPTLSGLGPVPGIAGVSPSYQVRQLFDMQAGTRKGLWSPLMKAVVSRLTVDDMLAIAAYTASLTPAPR